MMKLSTSRTFETPAERVRPKKVDYIRDPNVNALRDFMADQAFLAAQAIVKDYGDAFNEARLAEVLQQNVGALAPLVDAYRARLNDGLEKDPSDDT